MRTIRFKWQSTEVIELGLLKVAGIKHIKESFTSNIWAILIIFFEQTSLIKVDDLIESNQLKMACGY